MNATIYRAQLTLERGAIINQLCHNNLLAASDQARQRNANRFRARLSELDKVLRDLEHEQKDVCSCCGESTLYEHDDLQLQDTLCGRCRMMQQ